MIGNHFSEIVDPQRVRPAGAAPVIVRVASGSGNYIATNHVVAKSVDATANDSCFEAQVDALLATESSEGLAVTTVVVDPGARANTVLDSGTVAQVVLDDAVNAFRPTPSVGS